MSIWQLLKKWRMGSQRKRQFQFVLGEPLTFHSLNTATQELDQLNSSSQAVSPPDITQHKLYKQWDSLSSRQKDLVAFACLNYTNEETAARLGIGVLTVKKYYQAVLNRLDLNSKREIRVKFKDWNFSEWERRQHPR